MSEILVTESLKRTGLVVKFNGKPLWSSLTEADHRAEIKNAYTLIQSPDKTYMCYRARLIDELPDAAPQPTAK